MSYAHDMKALAVVLLLLGCSSATRASFRPTAGAPELAPSDFPPGIRDSVPPNAKELGLVEVTGDAEMTAEACKAKMVEEVQQYGANVVVVSYAQGGSSDTPAGCHGTAYYVPSL